MKATEEKWMDDVLQSLDGMQQVNPGDVLFNRIEQRIKTKPDKVPTPLLYAIAASLALLLVANWQVLKQAKTSNNPMQSDLNVLANDYQLYQTNDANTLLAQ